MNIEEAADKYEKEHTGIYPEVGQTSIRDAFIGGAEWQKEQDEKEQADLFTIVALDAAQRAREQMMKEAVEGFIFQSADYYPKQLIAGYDGELGMGDKVRIIIVKEEEK